MDIDKVLTSFENLATKTCPNIRDPDFHRKLIGALDSYPFPGLSSAEEWRKKQIRSALEQQILLLDSRAGCLAD